MDEQQAKEFYKTLEKADKLREQATEIENRALHRSGWEYTSETPGSYWLWRKEIKGKVYLLTREMALATQQGEAFLLV